MAHEKEQVEAFVDRIIEKIPYKKLYLFKKMVFHPEETIEEEKNKVAFGEGIKAIFLSSLLNGFFHGLLAAVFIVIMFFVMGGIASLTNPLNSWGFGGAGLFYALVIFIISAIFSPILSVAGSLIWTGVLYVFIKILGGEPKFKQLFYLDSLGRCATIWLAIFMIPFLIIPLVNNFVSLISFLFSIYILYVTYLIIKNVYGLSAKRSVGVLALSYLSLLIFIFGFIVLFYFILISTAIGINVIPAILKLLGN